jgi:hypothetical protein
MEFGVIWGNAFKVFSGFFGIRLQCKADQGLTTTAVIDEPTLDSLGLA